VVKSLTRNPSDHAPLLWENGKNDIKKEIRLRFEMWWLQYEELGRIVKSVWEGEKAIDGRIE
jgi:hypothetical protein